VTSRLRRERILLENRTPERFEGHSGHDPAAQFVDAGAMVATRGEKAADRSKGLIFSHRFIVLD
jgi:hypothetical protein